MKKIIFLFSLSLSLSAQALEPQAEHSININGVGEVEVAVDNVIINTGIDTRDRNLATARDENQKKYNNLLGVIEKAGLDKSAIKANFSSVNPAYVPCFPTPQNPQPKCDAAKIDYYQVNRSIEIKLSDLQKYDGLIAALSEAGASNINTGEYGVSDIGKYRDQARDEAIDAARGKAEKIAKKLGVTLGKPIRFESYEAGAEPPSPVHPMMARAMVMGAASNAAMPATDIETLGKIKVTVNVNIAYGIE